MTTKVHRLRYYNPTPQLIHCASLNKTSKLLAIARGDASIEIWDLTHAPCLIKFVPGVENGSLEAICWVCDRLLSTGLGGALIEWDLEKLSVKNSVLLTGYAAWCLDVDFSDTLVAVGTEQGYVNIYNVSGGEINYEKLFDKQEGRILCCKFNNDGTRLVTGSVDSIRVWNVGNGHAITRMSTRQYGNETIIWCLAVLSDGTVASGDSHGRLTFWDMTLGDQIESHTTHKADILSIAVSNDEKSLYIAGVDPMILKFMKVIKGSSNGQSTTQWVKNMPRFIHEHDVKVLLLNDERLISLGADGYLTLSSYPPKCVIRIPPMIPAPRSYFSAQKKLLLLRYKDRLDVWKLGTYKTNENGHPIIRQNESHEIVKKSKGKNRNEVWTLNINKPNTNQDLIIEEKPIKLSTIISKGKKQIQCCDISPSGELIVYSTNSAMRMLKLEVDEEQTTLSKVMITGVSGCDRVAFSDDSKTMVLHSEGAVKVLQVDPDAGATIIQTIQTRPLLKSSLLHLMMPTSEDGKTYLVAGDAGGWVAVWRGAGARWEHYASVPRHACVPAAVTYDRARDSLLIVYSDQKILEYNLTQKKVNEWNHPQLPAHFSAVSSITPHPREHAALLITQTALVTVYKTQKEYTEPEVKKRTQSKDSSRGDTKVTPIKYLAGFHWVNEDEAVTVEILPEKIVSQLPPALRIKTGRK